MENDKCQAGCKIYSGNEVKHHKDCIYYPESLSKMYDDLKQKHKTKKFSFVFTEEVFIQNIEALKKQHDHDRKCSDAFAVILPNDYTSNYNNDVLYNQLIEILKVAMNDDTENSWIEYYVWELDFGRKFKKGMVKIYEKDISLKTPLDLWKILTENNKS